MKVIKFALYGTCALLLFLTFYFSPIAYLMDAGKTEGRIVSFNQTMSRQSHSMVVAPVVEYEVDDVTYHCVAEIATDFNDDKIGDQIEVLYQKSNPAKGRINAFWDLWLTAIVLGGVFLIVLFVTIAVIRSLTSSHVMTREKQLILSNGIETEGVATFVDKNYSTLVNQKPIFTIVEYKFTDHTGKEHIRKVDKIDSDLVIRLKLEVGSKLKVKYLREDPAKNVILFG